MRVRWIAARGAALALSVWLTLTLSLSATGDEPRDKVQAGEKTASESPAASTSVAVDGSAAEKKTGDAPATQPAADAGDAELIALKKATIVRLKELEESSKPDEKGKDPDKDKLARAKALSDTLKERLRILEVIESTVQDRKKAQAPKSDPEREKSELAAAVERAQLSVKRANEDKASLLPEALRRDTAKTNDEKDALLNQIKKVLSSAQETAKEQRDALEALKSSSAVKGGRVASRKAERDAVRQRVVTLAARKAEADAAVTAAAGGDARELARERIINIEWEAKLESERLKDAEARIALETQRVALVELDLALKQAQVDLSRLTADQVQHCYQQHVDRRQRELEQIAAEFKAHAAAANDPIERYRAKRAVDLANLHYLVLQEEQAATATPKYSPEEQRALLQREEADYKNLSKLLEGGRSTSVVANRMNLTFRRLSSRRASLARDQLAEVINFVTKYENSLTDVELAQLNDGNENREAVQALMESLPASRHGDAKALCDRWEKKYQEYLERRRFALVELADRSEAVREQMVQRLKLMDDELAYVRMHIFWVRDSVPLGRAALAQISMEGRRISAAIGDIGEDLVNRGSLVGHVWRIHSGDCGRVGPAGDLAPGPPLAQRPAQSVFRRAAVARGIRSQRALARRRLRALAALHLSVGLRGAHGPVAAVDGSTGLVCRRRTGRCSVHRRARAVCVRSRRARRDLPSHAHAMRSPDPSRPLDSHRRGTAALAARLVVAARIDRIRRPAGVSAGHQSNVPVGVRDRGLGDLVLAGPQAIAAGRVAHGRH